MARGRKGWEGHALEGGAPSAERRGAAAAGVAKACEGVGPRRPVTQRRGVVGIQSGRPRRRRQRSARAAGGGAGQRGARREGGREREGRAALRGRGRRAPLAARPRGARGGGRS
jgi:hypothetical protein